MREQLYKTRCSLLYRFVEIQNVNIMSKETIEMPLQNNGFEEQAKETYDKKLRDEKLAKGIMMSIDLEANFKLYSFRVIDENAFIDRINELIQMFMHEENGSSNAN